MGILLKRCPARFAFLLEHPFRRLLLRPDRLVASLPLQPGLRVLDVGAGSGVVAEAVAAQLSHGVLILIDPQLRMLTRARKRLHNVTTCRFTFVAAVAEHLPLADASFDIVLMVTVLGEVDDPVMAVREVHRVLRPGGLVSVSEHLPDPDFRAAQTIRRLMRECGFTEREHIGGRWSYTANFVKHSNVGA